MIGWISSYVPMLIEILSTLSRSSDSDKSAQLAIPSILNTVLALIKFQGFFISPYFAQILELFVLVHPLETKNIRTCFDEIFVALPQSIEPHILLPVLLLKMRQT